MTSKDKKKSTNCVNLRSLLNRYYNIYKTINNNKGFIDNTDNWTTSQNDVFDLFNFFTIIFKLPNTTKVVHNKNPPLFTDFSTFIPPQLLFDQSRPIVISDFFPINKTIHRFKDKKQVEDVNEILKSDKLLIKVYRNIGSIKSSTQIIPAVSLKLKENNFDLFLNALIIHYGGNKGGHFICLYKSKNKWYEYDDMQPKPRLIGTLDDIIKNFQYSKNIVGLVYSKE